MKSEPWLAVKDHAGRIREFLSVGNFMPSAESHRSEITWDSWISVMLVTKVQTECDLYQIILRQRWRTHLYIAACWSTVGSPWIQTNCSNNRSYWKICPCKVGGLSTMILLSPYVNDESKRRPGTPYQKTAHLSIQRWFFKHLYPSSRV